MKRLLNAVRGFIRRGDKDAEIRDELAFHFEQEVEGGKAAGLTEDEARRAAHRDLGSRMRVEEDARAAWGWRVALSEYFGGLRRDVMYALRVLRRAPGFAVVGIATLALGIGASTAIFTVVDSVLLRSLRFAEPERLAMVWTTAGSRVSSDYFHDWRLESRALQDMAAWFDAPVNLTGEGEPLEVLADRVTSNFFTVLGTPAVVGRTFTPDESLRTVDPEVVLSHGLWQRRYSGDPDVVGRAITLNGASHTIVGVMPQGFAARTVELSESRADLWVPFSLVPDDRPGMGGHLNVVARLAPGATTEQARTELDAISQRIEQQRPSYSRNWGVRVDPLHEATVKDVRLILLVLFGGVGILLLIACVNVANLVLSRAATRQTELAIRISLGATGGRLMRQFLVESLVLATAGGVLGALLAAWGTALLVSVLPAGLDLPRAGEIGVDARALGFAFLVTILTAILFGLIPSVNVARSAPQSALREATRGSSSGSNTLRSVLIVSEVALALVLLAGAGLLGRSFWELSRVDPGFRAEQVLTMQTTLAEAEYDTDDRVRGFSRELLERVDRLPGIRAVGTVGYLPMSRAGAGSAFDIEGRTTTGDEDRPGSWINVVGGRYFEAMGIPLLRGRLPDDTDTERTRPVVVIDETLARRHWPDSDPIGARLVWRRGTGEMVSRDVIGVVGRVHWAGRARDPQATTYFWFPQDPGRQMVIVARTAGDPMATAGLIAAEVRGINPNQPVADIRAMHDLLSADLAQPRFTMLLLGCFAAAALLLSAIGLYGVIAFSVAQRTREIGIRVALGARYRDVVQLVMGRGVLLVGSGLAIGIASALVSGRFLASLLYGVTPYDPETLLAVTLFLAAVAVLATYLPARRATRVDPVVALRAE